MTLMPPTKRRRGRPRRGQGLCIKTSVSLLPEEVRQLKAIGNGSISRGIQFLMTQHFTTGH